MTSRVIRWIAVPLSFAAGIFGAAWLFLDMRLACLHFGERPEGLCSDWWYANHGWVAVVAAGLCTFTLSVLVPVLLAPRHNGVVAFSAFAVALGVTLATFTSPVRWWVVLVYTIAALAVLPVLSIRLGDTLPGNQVR